MHDRDYDLYYLPAIVTFLSTLMTDIFQFKISFMNIRIIGKLVLSTSLSDPQPVNKQMAENLRANYENRVATEATGLRKILAVQKRMGVSRGWLATRIMPDISK